MEERAGLGHLRVAGVEAGTSGKGAAFGWLQNSPLRTGMTWDAD